MKRAWAMLVTATTVLVVSGCGVALYESRLEETLKDLRYASKLDTFLQNPAEGKLKELSVWLRVPKPMTEDKLALNTAAGSFDYGATFAGSPTPPAVAEGEPAPPVLPPLKLHVLVRQKPKKAAAKKGEAPPAIDPNAANRGAFISDVKQVLAAEFGGEAASDKPPVSFTANKNNFKNVKFAAANGDDVRVYFAEANKGDLEAALIFDVPPALRTNPIATDGIELCLKSFALGNPARKLFNGPVAGGSKDGGDAPATGF